ncbi:hypothetical protein [Streptomyces puniciscabiei]|uniref:hypothetical protein n=1 Tax=Streptomyces puniciscabiei TaxID=164348 RepID=UPI003793FBD9
MPSFPTSDMLTAFSNYLHFQGLEQTFRERHPELAERVRAEDSHGRMFVKVTLSGKRGVVLSLTRMGHSTVWTVVEPVLDSVPSVWPVGTPDEVLVDALHAVATAHLTGQPIASPWRWNESEPSEMTELADRLDARDVRVLRVAAGNGYFPYGPRHELRLAVTARHERSFLEARCDEAFVRVSLKPTLGWMVDVHTPQWEGWRRMRLGQCLGRRSSPSPGVPRTDASVEEITELLGQGPRAWETEPPWEHSSLDRSRLTTAVLEQLTAIGFADLSEGTADAPIESEAFHIEWRDSTKNMSAPEMQRLGGLAAAAGEDLPKRLILITRGGLTRPAAAFADQAKAFVFHLDRTTGRLRPVNTRAEEAMPPAGEPGWRGPEPW